MAYRESKATQVCAAVRQTEMGVDRFDAHQLTEPVAVGAKTTWQVGVARAAAIAVAVAVDEAAAAAVVGERRKIRERDWNEDHRRRHEWSWWAGRSSPICSSAPGPCLAPAFSVSLRARGPQEPPLMGNNCRIICGPKPNLFRPLSGVGNNAAQTRDGRRSLFANQSLQMRSLWVPDGHNHHRAVITAPHFVHFVNARLKTIDNMN
jgi:hypothetical protein